MILEISNCMFSMGVFLIAMLSLLAIGVVYLKMSWGGKSMGFHIFWVCVMLSLISLTIFELITHTFCFNRFLEEFLKEIARNAKGEVYEIFKKACCFHE